MDRPGNALIADHHGERIRRVDRRRTITTIAGTGKKGASAERGPATKLNLNDHSGLALGEPGILYVAELFKARIMAGTTRNESHKRREHHSRGIALAATMLGLGFGPDASGASGSTERVSVGAGDTPPEPTSLTFCDHS